MPSKRIFWRMARKRLYSFSNPPKKKGFAVIYKTTRAACFFSGEFLPLSTGVKVRDIKSLKINQTKSAGHHDTNLAAPTAQQKPCKKTNGKEKPQPGWASGKSRRRKISLDPSLLARYYSYAFKFLLLNVLGVSTSESSTQGPCRQHDGRHRRERYLSHRLMRTEHIHEKKKRATRVKGNIQSTGEAIKDAED